MTTRKQLLLKICLFTAVASGAGNNVVTVTPSSTGGTSYSVDFGTNASDDVTVTAGPGVSYTYPEVDASYTIEVTASATDAINATSEKIVAVDFNEPIPSVLGRDLGIKSHSRSYKSRSCSWICRMVEKILLLM